MQRKQEWVLPSALWRLKCEKSLSNAEPGSEEAGQCGFQTLQGCCCLETVPMATDFTANGWLVFCLFPPKL
jgi:hypothetical protein